MKTFMLLGINIDCICDKLNLKSTVKNVSIKTESVITKCYQRLVLQSVFSKDIMLFTDFTSSSSKLIEINLFVVSIFNSDISFFITSWITWARQKIVSYFLFQFTSCSQLSSSAISFHIMLLLLALSVIIARRWDFRLFCSITLFTVSFRFWSSWLPNNDSNSTSLFWYFQFLSI